MKVLVLSPYAALLHPAIEAAGDTYVDCVLKPERWPTDCDFVVSFGYRHIIEKTYLDKYKGRIINVHISYLPWNRGADPNFWSWFDNTPKGVSIHQLTEGIDTGDILVQQRCGGWISNETLDTSWHYLIATAKDLFERSWVAIRDGAIKPKPQIGLGSYHKASDKEMWMALLPDRWETPVEYVEWMGELYREEVKNSGSGAPGKHWQPPLQKPGSTRASSTGI